MLCPAVPAVLLTQKAVELLRQIFDHSVEGVVSFDDHGHCWRRLSEGLTELFEVIRGDHTGIAV